MDLHKVVSFLFRLLMPFFSLMKRTKNQGLMNTRSTETINFKACPLHISQTLFSKVQFILQNHS